MRASLLALLLATSTLLAGCLSSTPPSQTAAGSVDPPTPTPPAGTFLSGGNATRLDPVVSAILARAEGAARYTGFEAFEPTLGVTPDGALFMSEFGGRAVRSLDQGATWELVAPLSGVEPYPVNDNDPYLYVDPDTGRVFTNANQAAACTILFFSDDLGETWQTNPAACPIPVNDHQTMVTAKPRGSPTVGYPNLVFMCVNAGYATNCARSLDGGLTFHPLPPAFVLVKDGCDASLGHLAASPDGILYLPKGHCGVATVFVSKDEGLTWTQREVSGAEGAWGHEVRVAVDEAGNAYAFWQGSDGLPYLSSSQDAGETWSPSRMVGFDGLTGMDFPAIAAGAPGKIAFAYLGTSFPKPYEVEGDTPLAAQLARPADIDGMAWYPYIGIMTDALAENATVLTVTAGAPADPVSRGQCGRTRCDAVGDFLGIQIGPDGRPWAAFADACFDACAEPDGKTNSVGRVGGASGPGFLGTLARGPALRGEAAELEPLLPAAPPEPEAGAQRGVLDALRRRLGL